MFYRDLWDTSVGLTPILVVGRSAYGANPDGFAMALEARVSRIDEERAELKEQAESLLNRHAELGAERPKLVKALESLGRKDPALAERAESKHVGVMC